MVCPLVIILKQLLLAWKTSNNLRVIIDKVIKMKEEEASGKPALKKKFSISIDLMTPVSPMLAR